MFLSGFIHLANYVDNQSFNMMMNVMMNTQSCYQPVNNYQLGSGVAQTGLGKCSDL